MPGVSGRRCVANIARLQAAHSATESESILGVVFRAIENLAPAGIAIAS